MEKVVKKTPLLYFLGKSLIKGLLRLFYRLEIHVPKEPYVGAAIIAANHTSFLDPPVLGVAWPEEVHFLARKTLFDIPLLGWLIRKCNTHPLKGDVGDVAVFKEMIHLLQEGKKVILFPEGQRSYDDRIADIKPGIALLVSKTRAAIIPAYIFGTFEAWPRTSKFPKLGKKIGCIFGSPLFWESESHLDKKQAQEAFALQVKEALQNLKLWYESGAQGTPP